MMHSETALLQTKTIDRYNGEKLYIQLTRIFLDDITSGRWQINERIPSEEELCKAHDVSKITVRQAINNLASDGYVMKIQGKGTFVTSVLPMVGLSMRTRFTEEMFGKEVRVDKKILLRGIKKPPPDVRRYLDTDDKICRILCRRAVNGEPAYLDDSYIPVYMLPDIEETDFSGISLYSVLQEKGTKKIFKVAQTIEICNAGAKAAGYLDIDEGAPVLAVHRLLFSSDNSPVAYTKLLGRSDRYKFQTEFERIR
jgi:GntR family transcriptional regulator